MQSQTLLSSTVNAMKNLIIGEYSVNIENRAIFHNSPISGANIAFFRSRSKCA